MIYQVACWFISSKFQLVSKSITFSQTFSADLEKIFCNLEHFVEKEKEGNHSLQGLVNIVSGVNGIEKTTLNPIFFQHDSCWMRPCIIIWKHNFSPIDKCKHVRFSCTRCNCRQYKSTLSVWLRFKNSIGIIPLGSSHNDVSLEWNFENKFRTWWPVMTPFGLKYYKFSWLFL